MSVEPRGPAICNVSDIGAGKDEMTKASIDLQDLRRRIYVKAKAEPSWRSGVYTFTSARWRPCAQRMRWPNRTMGLGSRRGDLRSHRGARRGGSARAATGRADWAHLPATPSPEAGDTEGRGQGPRPFDTGDPGQGWYKARSSSYSSLSSRRISNRDRLDIGPSGQHMT